MHEYALTHLSDALLLRDLNHLVREDRVMVAKLLAHLAEVDARRLYVSAGHPSMFAYCVEELHFSEDTAYKRIRAARAGRQFPEILSAIAEGKLHLAAVSLLAPHLTAGNVRELIEASTHRSKAEVETLVASKSSPGGPVGRPYAVIRPLAQLAPGRVMTALGDLLGSLGQGTAAHEQGSDRVDSNVPADRTPTPSASTSQALVQAELAPGRVEPPATLPEPDWYSVHLRIPKSMHDKIRRLQALLSHSMPSGDIVQVLERAVEIALVQVEARKIGSCRSRTDSRAKETPHGLRDGVPGVRRAKAAKVNPSVPRAARSRYIPAHVRRAVWERDRGQCTFVTYAGHRCSARRFLEFDHVEPVARGGRATVPGLRLRCRAHNQYEAERIFGAEFMKQKRNAARALRNSASQPDAAIPTEGTARDENPELVREPKCLWEVSRKRSPMRGTTARPGAGLPSATRYFALARSGASFT